MNWSHSKPSTATLARCALIVACLAIPFQARALQSLQLSLLSGRHSELKMAMDFENLDPDFGYVQRMSDAAAFRVSDPVQFLYGTQLIYTENLNGFIFPVTLRLFGPLMFHASIPYIERRMWSDDRLVTGQGLGDVDTSLSAGWGWRYLAFRLDAGTKWATGDADYTVDDQRMPLGNGGVDLHGGGTLWLKPLPFCDLFAGGDWRRYGETSRGAADSEVRLPAYSAVTLQAGIGLHVVDWLDLRVQYSQRRYDQRYRERDGQRSLEMVAYRRTDLVPQLTVRDGSGYSLTMMAVIPQRIAGEAPIDSSVLNTTYFVSLTGWM